ncbi:MAG: hypothetical protein QGI75_05835 [Phycisphaerales bacterium]|jgi:hypothetical protein|nr:hypothetical protein [Phycisphaerales bacterium]MDP6890905.1 hypothetical protein [Phycisphaerales bacterium]
MRIRSLLVFASLAAVLSCSGCDSRSRRASARLRTENALLLQQIDALESRQRELKASLQAIDAESPTRTKASAEVPQVATITVSSMSGFEPGETEDGMVLEVHVQATDGKQRPIQLVGPLEAQVLRPVPGEPPQLLVDLKLDPEAVREAWRSSLFGATYLIPIPMATSDVQPDMPLLVHVFHDDLRTARRLEASGTVAHHLSTDDR